MADSIRILSIDGGGIRGIIPAIVLQTLLGDRKAQDAFHIIAGTSTGGIIACGLAKPNPLRLEDIIELYTEHGWDIFNKDTMNVGHTIHGPRYSPAVLETQLASQLGNTYLSEVKDVELFVPSYAIGLPKEKPPTPMFFRSWQARGFQLEGITKQEYDFKLASIARATSAAPTYFPPANIVNKAGQSFTMIDGGVFANNPTICAIVEAYRLYGSTNFMIVSIGTGIEPVKVDASNAGHWGDIEWLTPILSILTTGNSQTVSVQTDELLGDPHWRLDISLTTPTPQGDTVNPEMDDASAGNINALVNKANQLIHAQRELIQTLATELATPRAVVQPKEQRPQKSMFSALVT